MSKKEYIYAVARIKSKENKLLDSATVEQMIQAPSKDSVLKILKDKGWGENLDDENEILSSETDKIWEFIDEIIMDKSELYALKVERDFHNIKVELKADFAKKSPKDAYLKYGTVPIKDIQDMVLNRDLNFIPEYMQKYAYKAYKYMVKTGDSQLCDIILDKAALEVMNELAEKSENHLLQEYAYIRSATSNIKIAIRGAKTRKNKMFFDLALVECKNLDKEQLAIAASQGLEAVYSYIETTVFNEVLDLIKEDFTAFEVWADNQIIKMIKKEKYTTTTITPIVAYILARENEIKVARILLVAKQNNLPVEEIKKRMRDMYV